MRIGKEDPVVQFSSQAEWAKWLHANHAGAKGVWLKLAKKSSGVASITTAEALEVALCYGWIDGQAAPLDDSFWLQRYTPRTPRSKWSQKNREAALQLIEAGKMQPAGHAQVEAARADGRWDAAYASPKNITVPEDLQAALDANATAQQQFNLLNKSTRFAILYRIQDAKKPETRLRRIEKYVAMLAAGQAIT
jgi:uncharacterized protein YdeI (YjbR/CyaY-like superfamily)